MHGFWFYFLLRDDADTLFDENYDGAQYFGNFCD